MKRKTLSILLALVMVVGLLPGTALAAGDDFVIEDGVLTKYNGPGGAVTVPSTVTAIGDGAFLSCTSVTSVDIPHGVTKIGTDVFSFCESLTRVAIPDSVTAIGEAFGICYSLTNIDVSENNSHFTSRDGVLFSKDMTKIVCCPGGKGPSYIIPDGVTTIGDAAFAYCSKLTDVTIPASVTTIGYNAFLHSQVKDIYFTGTEGQWGSIDISEYAFPFGVPTVHYSGAQEETPLPVDKEDLQNFLHQFHFGWGEQTYDFRNVNTQEKNILQALIGDARSYAGPVPGRDRFYGETNWNGKDPLGKWNAFHKTSATQVDWILEHVFNCSQSNIAALRSSLSLSTWGEYYLDGNYYSSANGIGDDMATAVIKEITPYENYYFVTYEIRDLESFGSERRGRYFAVVEQKTVEGRGYWSLYYNRKLEDGETPDLPTPTPSTGFTDVPANEYYTDPVKWAVANGITSGTGDGTTFSPNNPCTRGQIVTFLWRAQGSPEVSANTAFADVAPGSYYEKAVKWAVANGVTGGTGNGRFDPDTPCTRAQAVTFMWRAAGEPSASGGSFADVPSGEYYADAVKWAVQKGVTSGTGNGFSPNNSCTRGQIVTFLYRGK